MRENLYVIYDKKAGIALKPVIVDRNDVQPVRGLSDLVNKDGNMLNHNPDDFDLVQIGSIDLETLEVQQETMRIVALASDLKLS